MTPLEGRERVCPVRGVEPGHVRDEDRRERSTEDKDALPVGAEEERRQRGRDDHEGAGDAGQRRGREEYPYTGCARVSERAPEQDERERHDDERVEERLREHELLD